jgi:cytoskeletal protein RodZ
VSFPGHELRARRLELNLSAETVSAECAIPVSMIDALEGGALDRLPAACFAVGFIRSYCRLLGLEPEYYVGALRFAQSGGANAGRSRGSIVGRWLRKLPIPGIPRVSSEFQAWVLVIGATALGWAAYTAVVKPATPHDAAKAQAATIELRLPDSLDGR